MNTCMTDEELIKKLRETKSVSKRAMLDLAADRLEFFLKTSPRDKAVTPDFEGDGYADGRLVYDVAHCPICGKDFEYGFSEWGSKFCANCGTALAWPEE